MKFNSMNRKRLMAFSSLAVLAASLGLAGCNDNNGSSSPAVTVGTMADYGVVVDERLAAESASLFGINAPLAASASGSIARANAASVYDLVALADGLSASILTSAAANKTDMIAFWPTGNSPTHAISCVEGSAEFLVDGGTIGTWEPGDKLNPSVQAIDLTTGAVTTLARGMQKCDGIRTTAWGTVLATEETDDGAAYELELPTDPTGFTEVTVTDRAAGTIVFSNNGNDAAVAMVKRTALPTMSWEGLEVLDSGVVISGDEERPGTAADDADGGALFKFVPTAGPTGTGLAGSPLSGGLTYALQVSCTTGTQYGQGCEVGNGSWVAVNAATARSDAAANGATGYDRPEDLHLDPLYTGPGARFCWANTGNEGAQNYGEVICGVDSDPTGVTGNTVIVNRFIEGDTDFNSVDNLAFNPVTGHLYVIEDHGNGDVWSCLPDGDDRDVKSDGCVKILSVKDQSAEPTGFTFHPNGQTAYVSIQHSDDTGIAPVDDYGTDDFLVINGFSLLAPPATDFGATVDADLAAASDDYFGVIAPLASSATGSIPRSAVVTADDTVLLADGLSATFLTREAGHKTDMFAFWPAGASPSHLISCVEGGNELLVDTNGSTTWDLGDKANPSVQAIDLNDGTVTTLARGMNRCDGIRTTPWGTVLATEEAGNGAAYELLLPQNPTAFAEVTVTDRAAGTIVFSADGLDATAAMVKRDALPIMAWEGLTVLESGVVIGGDELRPGTGTADSDGGALFKFVPSTPHAGGVIADLADSPLVAGSAHALQVSCRDSKQQYGQGCEVGNGAWIGVNAASARSDANANGATGFYRPEDLHLDPLYAGDGVRFCWANTGNEGASNYGEVMCGIDSEPVTADPTVRSVVINRFVEGDTEFNSVDNLAFNPVTGQTFVIEDHSNGDVWACLKDGADRDIKTDGCIRVLSVRDQSAEPTGFTFHPSGLWAYVSIQHSDDTGIADVDDYGTDDVLVINGFGLLGAPY